MKSSHSTAFDLITTFITKIIFLAGSFMITVILARILGPNGKGVVTALFVFPNIMVSLADLGVRQASAYYIGKGKYESQAILSVNLFLWIVTSILSVFIVSIYFFNSNSGDLTISLGLIALSYVPVRILISYFNGILQGQQKITNMNKKFLIEFSMRLIGIFLLVWLLNLNVTGAALATLLTNVVVLIYSGIIIKKHHKFKISFDRLMISDLFKKGIIFAMALFVLQLNYKVDIIILDHMVTPHDLGIYSVGVSIAELLWQLPAAIGIVLFSRSANSSTDKESTNRATKILRLSWPPLIAVASVLMTFTPQIVDLLYGSNFEQASTIIRLLLPGVMVMVLFKILYSDLAGRGHPLFALKIFSVSLVINLLFNLILIPIYGINGAAISSTMSYIVGAVLFSKAYKNFTGISYGDLFIINNNDKRTIDELIKKIINKRTREGTIL